MVVIVAACVFQLLRLALGQHTEGAAGFEPFRFHCRDHFSDPADLAVTRAAPGRTHAEPVGTGLFGGARGVANVINTHQRLVGQAGVVKDALGAIGTIFRTPTGFDIEQRRGLDAVGVEILPMYGMGAIKKIVERKLKEIEGPA